MNVILPANKKKLLIKELLQGKEYATQLKVLLKNHVASDGSSSSSVKELMANVLRSFSETISVVNSSEACSSDEVHSQDGSLVAASCNDDMKSEEDSSESRKRLSLSPTTKDRRGSYKRRSFFFSINALIYIFYLVIAYYFLST